MASTALSTQRRAPSTPHSSKVTPPDERAREPGLEARELARVEAAVGLAALERLVVVVGAEVRVDELDHDAPLRPRFAAA